MPLPEVNIEKLLHAGVHFGHKKHVWNPKVEPYLFGVRNDTHIIDLTQTVPLLRKALKFVSDVVANGGCVLFVGTKRQAAQIIADTAQRCAQYYINKRWFGGTLTNWQTISVAISRLKELESNIEDGYTGLTKRESLTLKREMVRLQNAVGGIKDMNGPPDLLFIIDTNKEKNAIAEARKLNIPIVGVVDSNCDPDSVDYPIPGNDDASRSISFYCDVIAEAVFDGFDRNQRLKSIEKVEGKDFHDKDLEKAKKDVKNENADKSDEQTETVSVNQEEDSVAKDSVVEDTTQAETVSVNQEEDSVAKDSVVEDTTQTDVTT